VASRGRSGTIARSDCSARRPKALVETAQSTVPEEDMDSPSQARAGKIVVADRSRLREGMPTFRKSFVFPRSVALHAATNRLEAAQQRWIQDHSDQLRVLVRLSDRSGLEIVAFDERRSTACFAGALSE